MVLAATQWGLDYLKYGFSGPPTVLRSFVFHHIKHFFQIVRKMAIIILMLHLIADRDSLLMWQLRNFLSAVFLAWAVVFCPFSCRIRKGMRRLPLEWIYADMSAKILFFRHAGPNFLIIKA
jgi:hypothetical protein